jgi:hypothetical protein
MCESSLCLNGICTDPSSPVPINLTEGEQCKTSDQCVNGLSCGKLPVVTGFNVCCVTDNNGNCINLENGLTCTQNSNCRSNYCNQSVCTNPPAGNTNLPKNTPCTDTSQCSSGLVCGPADSFNVVPTVCCNGSVYPGTTTIICQDYPAGAPCGFPGNNASVCASKVCVNGLCA